MDSPVISPEAYKAMMKRDRKLAARIRQRRRRGGWKRQAPKTNLARYDTYLRRTYDLSRQDAVLLWESQDRRCPGCGKEIPEPSDLSGRQIHIDHDHLTLEIRGVLCSRCNAAIGMAGDSIETLERLVAYLKAHKQASPIYRTIQHVPPT